jgi:hypothetical protein
MAEHEHYKKVEPIGEAERPKTVDPSEASDTEGPSKAKFDAALEKADTSRIERRQDIASIEGSSLEAKKASLLDLATKATSEASKVTPTQKTLSDQATTLKNQLQRPRAVLLDAGNVPFDAKTTTTLSGHIEHMDRALRDATKLTSGVETGSQVSTDKPAAVRFLNYLTESDKNLTNFVNEINAMEASKDKLTPAKMLACQIKLGFVQQELEFFTTVLNKALESTKTIMNVQI